MRRRLALAALTFPVSIGVIAVLGYGCSPKAPAIQDFCGFLGNEDNCYLEFFKDIGARCGVTSPTEGGLSAPPQGYFLSRDKLDKCILTSGGSITFNTPLDLAAFPPASIAFSRLDATGVLCGSFSFAGPFDFSVTVKPTVGDKVVNDAGPACSPGGSDSGTDDADAGTGGLICGGTFSSSTIEGDFVDTTCPDGEAHHFISLQLDREECAAQKALLLRYEIDAQTGGIDTPGFVSVRAFYPTGETVDFFKCDIPGAPKQCCNGVQDGSETGIDCGGPEEPAAAACDRCAGGQGCIGHADCASEMCNIDMVSGLKVCEKAMAQPPSICNDGTGGGSAASSGAGGAGGAGGI